MKRKLVSLLVCVLTIMMITVPALASEKSLTVKGRVTSCYVGQTVPLWVSFSDTIKKADRKVTWKSSDKTIATVNAKGEVKTKKAGKVKITAVLKSDSSKKASYKLKVKKIPNDLDGVSEYTCKAGQKVHLTAYEYLNVVGHKIEWTTDNRKVATVNSGGIVSTKRKGTVNVTGICSCGRTVFKIKLIVKSK